MTLVRSAVPACTLLLGALLLAPLGCSSDDDDDAGGGGGDACSSLCKGASFSGGSAAEFANATVTECVCTGAGKGLEKAACEGYCSSKGVDAQHAYLSQQSIANDKCVCDGTQK